MNADLNYIAVTAKDGELVAFYDENETIIKDGHDVRLGYGEPVFETSEDGNIYMNVENFEEMENINGI